MEISRQKTTHIMFLVMLGDCMSILSIEDFQKIKEVPFDTLQWTTETHTYTAPLWPV